MGTVSGPAGYLSMCICLLTKALMHDACRIWRRGECTDLFNIVCVWFRILCFRVNPWPLFMFASVDLWVLLVFVKFQISIFPGGTLIRKVGEKSFFWAMDCHAQDGDPVCHPKSSWQVPGWPSSPVRKKEGRQGNGRQSFGMKCLSFGWTLDG